MLDISLVIKIGIVGIVMIILEKVLKSGGKEEYATISNIACIIMILILVVGLVAKLFGAIETLFTF